MNGHGKLVKWQESPSLKNEEVNVHRKSALENTKKNDILQKHLFAVAEKF